MRRMEGIMVVIGGPLLLYLLFVGDPLMMGTRCW